VVGFGKYPSPLVERVYAWSSQREHAVVVDSGRDEAEVAERWTGLNPVSDRACMLAESEIALHRDTKRAVYVVAKSGLADVDFVAA